MKEINNYREGKKPSTSDRIADCAILFLLCLGICMPVSLMVLAMFWVVGLAIGFHFPFTFSNYYILNFFFALLIWVTWMIDTKGRIVK